MAWQGTEWVPQHHRDITLQRLDGFLSTEPWHSDVNIQQDLYLARGENATM